MGVWGGLLCLNYCSQFWYQVAMGGKRERMGGGEEGDGGEEGFPASELLMEPVNWQILSVEYAEETMQ